MEVTISPKYQVVIPKSIRRRLCLKPKERLGVMTKNNSIILTASRPLEGLRGICKGLNMDGFREEEEIS